VTDWGEGLTAWYQAQSRDLPWRRACGPYPVWVSEAMLQQTTVAAVLPYFKRWMARFPTVEALAEADLEDALAVWAGLGYYRRCRSLHDGARTVAARGWPADYGEWLRLPGVGPYTAAALASIVGGEPRAAVDGNVVRVYARLNNDHRAGPALHRAACSWAEGVLDRCDPGTWNQALMELGATVCKPRAPECGACPVARACRGLAAGSVAGLPKRAPRPAPVRSERTMVVPLSHDRVGLVKAPAGRWWHGLWEFPQSEDPAEWLSKLRPSRVDAAGGFSYTVTRHRVALNVVVATGCAEGPEFEWRRWDDVSGLALASPTRRALSLAPVVRAARQESRVHGQADDGDG
jgi:A/G-specific adenine glycosylase